MWICLNAGARAGDWQLRSVISVEWVQWWRDQDQLHMCTSTTSLSKVTSSSSIIVLQSDSQHQPVFYFHCSQDSVSVWCWSGVVSVGAVVTMICDGCEWQLCVRERKYLSSTNNPPTSYQTWSFTTPIMDVETEMVYADILRTLQNSILNTSSSVSLKYFSKITPQLFRNLLPWFKVWFQFSKLRRREVLVRAILVTFAFPPGDHV